MSKRIIDLLTMPNRELLLAAAEFQTVLLQTNRSGEAELVEQFWRQTHPDWQIIKQDDSDSDRFKIESIQIFLHLANTKSDLMRLVVINQAENLTTAAQNALLKTLEEPPKNTFFWLISSNPGAILPTIRSRARLAKLLPLEPNLLADYFKDSLDELTPTEQAQVKFLAGDNLELWQQLLASEKKRQELFSLAKLAKQIASGNTKTSLELLKQAPKDRQEVLDLIQLITRFLEIQFKQTPKAELVTRLKGWTQAHQRIQQNCLTELNLALAVL